MKKLRRFLVAALIAVSAMVGVQSSADTADAGLYGCKWWVIQTTGSPYYSTIAARATCDGVTPGGYHMFRLRGKCSDGTYVYSGWKVWYQTASVTGYSCFNAPTYTLTQITLSYKT